MNKSFAPEARGFRGKGPHGRRSKLLKRAHQQGPRATTRLHPDNRFQIGHVAKSVIR